MPASGCGNTKGISVFLFPVFDDQMIPSVRQKRETPPPPLDEIRLYLYNSRFNDFQILPNFGAHDVLSGIQAGENAMRIGRNIESALEHSVVPRSS